MVRVKCPYCHTPGAEKFLWIVKCPKKGCRAYNEELAVKLTPRPLTGTYDPGPSSITLRYRNHLDQDRDFRGDKATLRSRRNHISMCLVPTGKRCAFDKKRIANLAEIERAMPSEAAALSTRERQIIGYHRKHNTTSPMLEAIARKIAHS